MFVLGYDGHSKRALIVVASSPVLRMGSTLKEAPSISPTPSSEELTLAGSPDCVPPVMRSVFSGCLSFGSYLGSTEVMNSGGGLSSPTDGMSLWKVEVVFVMCGTSGLDFWSSLYASALGCIRPSCSLALSGVAVDNARNDSGLTALVRPMSLAIPLMEAILEQNSSIM